MTGSPRSPGLQLLAFQGVWIVSAFGAAAGTAWPGIVAAVVLLGWYVLAAGGGRQGIVLALSCGLTGLVAESALVRFGWVSYGAPWPDSDLAPIWVIGRTGVVRGGFQGAECRPPSYWRPMARH